MSDSAAIFVKFLGPNPAVVAIPNYQQCGSVLRATRTCSSREGILRAILIEIEPTIYGRMGSSMDAEVSCPSGAARTAVLGMVGWMGALPKHCRGAGTAVDHTAADRRMRAKPTGPPRPRIPMSGCRAEPLSGSLNRALFSSTTAAHAHTSPLPISSEGLGGRCWHVGGRVPREVGGMARA